MGSRSSGKTGERETFLIVFIVMAGLAAYLGPWGNKPAPPPSAVPRLVASEGGLEKLWLDASLGKGDMRPLPDKEELAEEPAPEPPPQLAAVDAPADEPAPSFPEPLPVAEEAPERQRIAPMEESLLRSGGSSGSSSSAFLAFPTQTKGTRAEAPPQKPPPPASASAAPPKRRTWRAVTGP